MLFIPMNGTAGGNASTRSASATSSQISWRSMLASMGIMAIGVVGAQAQTPGQTSAAPITQEKDPGSDAAGADDSNRVNESFQPKGLEVGSFLFFPKIELDTLYNSNVFAQETDKKSDMLLRVSPEFQFRSRFTRHELNATAKAERYIYDTYSSDDRTDLSGNVNSRLDIDRTWESTFDLDAFKRAEDRGSPDDAGGVKPTPTYGLGADIGTRKEQGRFVFAANAEVKRRTFDNVETSNNTTINNHDRDRWEYVGRVRTEYAVYDVVSVVGTAELNQRDYDDRLDDNGFARSSDGYRVEGGFNLDISDVIKGDFTAGYFEQNYDDTRLKSPSGLSFRAKFNWTPSRMTVVVPSLEREVDETISTNVSSLVRTSAGLLIRHELQRNLILTGSGNIRHEKYEGTSERVWTYESRFRGTYAFSPEFFAAGDVSYRNRDSNQADNSFDQWVVMARIGARI
jgi:hypothetical protein